MDIDGEVLEGFSNAGSSARERTAISAMNRDFVRATSLPKSPRDLWNGLALTTEALKFVWELTKDRRLAFDLVADPGETNDISSTSSSVLDSGWELLDRELTRARVGPRADADAIRERLRALGYLVE